MILVSATPLNNRPEDIANLVYLFQDSKDNTLEEGNLQRFFREQIDKYKKVKKQKDIEQISKCKNTKWSYEGIENWDFETNSQNNTHVLLNASPNLIRFFESCCQKLPSGITPDMLMHNCKIDNKTPLIEFFSNLDLLKIAVKVKK